MLNKSQSILEIHNAKISAHLIHNPTVDYLAARKTLLQVVSNDGYFLVFVLPLYAAGTELSKTKDCYAGRTFPCQSENIRNIKLLWSYVDPV